MTHSHLGKIFLVFNLWKLPDEHKNEKLFLSLALVVKMNLLKCELYFMIIEFVSFFSSRSWSERSGVINWRGCDDGKLLHISLWKYRGTFFCGSEHKTMTFEIYEEEFCFYARNAKNMFDEGLNRLTKCLSLQKYF